MIWITIFIAFIVSLLFFLLRAGNRGNNPAHPSGDQNQSNVSGNTAKVNKYTALKSFLEKSFAKKREQKTKFLDFLVFFKKIILDRNFRSL